ALATFRRFMVAQVSNRRARADGGGDSRGYGLAPSGGAGPISRHRDHGAAHIDMPVRDGRTPVSRYHAPSLDRGRTPPPDLASRLVRPVPDERGFLESAEPVVEFPPTDEREKHGTSDLSERNARRGIHRAVKVVYAASGEVDVPTEEGTAGDRRC